MDPENRWEILGLVVFAQPYRRTAKGEFILARFSVKSGSLTVSGALLLEGPNERRSVWFSSARDPRIRIESEVARAALVRLVTIDITATNGRIKIGSSQPLAEAPDNAGNAGSGAFYADNP